ncbi:hypothetical protein ACVIWV_009451 [Bradyrhizobium diazoefficiens]|uniref:hypothetical protein n=1 Tax=Bradyrhizobium TaxID=374 RepID=UPI000765B9EC|nr:MULTISPECIES: hypothetical protein [Bradyrhizobium]MBP1096017.1 hypothetical protein [Bradyrhizobium japonicum]MBR0867828.1 hypothetical protein [Bradyrhizobium diazoefficiens]MBR0892421.1 hypothetical protein [Bradyrhizobium diazoefficiens]MBR0924102.1 hypothetical protein [Bradyrhizobium diazoefficiens]MDA9539003.1 hypothetical protein [Bradyrhizobium sp. CCBAU 21362]
MDMKEASAMTEPSGLTDAQGGIERASEAGPSGRAEPRVFQRHSPQSDMAVRWADQLREVTVKAPLQSLFVAFLLGLWVARRR